MNEPVNILAAVSGNASAWLMGTVVLLCCLVIVLPPRRARARAERRGAAQASLVRLRKLICLADISAAGLVMMVSGPILEQLDLISEMISVLMILIGVLVLLICSMKLRAISRDSEKKSPVKSDEVDEQLNGGEE